MTIAINGGKRMFVVTPDMGKVMFNKSINSPPQRNTNKPDHDRMIESGLIISAYNF
jgi:hypothetical protein